MDKKLFRISVVAIVAIGAIVGIYIYTNLSKRPEFSTYQVMKGDITEVLDASGKVRSENNADLGFEIGGRITALNFKVGDKVPKGSILATANSADLNAQYRATLSQVQSARATLKQLEELKDKSKYDLKALKSPNDTSADKNAQKEQIGSNKAGIEAQEAQILSLQQSAQSIQADIQKTIIRTPFDGILAKQDVEVGEVAVSNTPILTVINGSEFKVEMFVSEIEAKKLVVGNSAQIILDSNPGKNYSAKITTIDPAETPINNVSSYKITLHFDQNSADFISGTGANVEVALQKKSGVLVVPKSAVFQENNKNYIYVSKNGLREKQEVDAGAFGNNNDVEIVSGISEGDTIFLIK